MTDHKEAITQTLNKISACNLGNTVPVEIWRSLVEDYFIQPSNDSNDSDIGNDSEIVNKPSKNDESLSILEDGESEIEPIVTT